MEISINSIQNKARKYLKDNKITEAIQCLEEFMISNKIRDDDFSDNLITLSQRNREIKGYDLGGALSYQDALLEKSRMTKKILSLINEIPILVQQVSGAESELKSLAPAITYLAKNQTDNLIEVRGQLISVDKLLMTLFEEVREREKKIAQLQGEVLEHQKLQREIDTLRMKIEEEQRMYNDLKSKYDELKKDKQKVFELDFQIEALKAKLEGKERELEILRESFIMSKELMENQRKEIERMKQKYE